MKKIKTKAGRPKGTGTGRKVRSFSATLSPSNIEKLDNIVTDGNFKSRGEWIASQIKSFRKEGK